MPAIWWPSWGRGSAEIEPALLQEGGHPLRHDAGETQPDMRHRQYAAIGRTFQLGFGHGHGAVVGSGEWAEQAAQAARVRAGDDSELRGEWPDGRHTLRQVRSADVTEQA